MPIENTNKGLRFDPTRTLGAQLPDSVTYKTTPFVPKDITKDPMFHLNRWDKGLSGLGQQERALWEKENAAKLAGKDEFGKDRLWRNQQLVKLFGVDNFLYNDNDALDAAYEDYFASMALHDKYKDNSNLSQIMSLTPKGKRELLQSGYQTENAIKKAAKEEHNRDWEDYSLGERFYTAANNAVSGMVAGIGVGAGAGAAYGAYLGTTAGTAVAPGVGTVLGMPIGAGAGTVLGALIGAGVGAAYGIIDPAGNEQQHIAHRKADNDAILEKIVASDNERKKEDSKDEISAIEQQYMRMYSDGQLTDEQINSKFDELALNGERTATDEFGNSDNYKYVGSNYYSAFKDTDEFETFGTMQKIHALAQAEVLARKYGNEDAMRVLEQDMTNYASDHQSAFTWAGNTAKNIWVGGLANLGQTVVGMGALSAYNAYGLKGAFEEGSVGDFIDNYRKYGQSALANYLEGKDASGDGTDNWTIVNPSYWNKVDQYNTLDTDAIKEADENGGVSKYNNVYAPGTENDFWSWSTLNESLKMTKFAWSDLVKNLAAAGILKAAVRGAGGVEIAPGVLASESTAASKALNTAGSFAILNGSSFGIDVAYGMNTYQEILDENNAKIEAIIQKDVNAEVERRLKTPEAKKNFDAFVKNENAKRKAGAGESGKWIPVDEEKAWQDYASYMEKQVRKELEGNYAEDREQARREAAAGFATDATIEQLRMASTAGMFKSYLFDKGTLNAIRMNNPYVDTTFKNGAFALGKNATRRKALSTLGENIWGGFHSNYYDDVTVGFAKGFGIQRYNNYLLSKYNPAAYGNVMDDEVDPWIAGLIGADNASREGRSFLDGAVGALGSVFTFSPNIQGAFNHKDTMKRLKEQAEADSKNGVKVSTPSMIEMVSHFVNNPVIQAVADAKEATRMTEREINRVNKAIKDNAYALDNIVEASSALNMRAITKMGDSRVEADDAKDKEAFTLASQLLSMKGSGVVVNAQVEPEKAKWFSLKGASKNIAIGLNNMLGTKLFYSDVETPYTRAMETLQDAATIDEASDFEEASRKQQLVDTFLGLTANKNVLPGQSKEAKEAFARERIKENAESFLDMMNNMEKLQQKFENSLGAALHPDVKQQLLYQYVLDRQWKKRLQGLEATITRDELTDADVEDVDTWYNNYMSQRNEEHSTIAKYGSYEGFRKAKEEQKKKIEKAQKAFDKAEVELKKQADPTKSVMMNAQINAMRRISKNNAEKVLKAEQAKAKAMEAEEKVFKEGDVVKEAPVLSMFDILKLNANDRLRMLDTFYRDNYSEAQKKEIDKATNWMYSISGNNAIADLRDAAILENRITDNMEVAKRIMDNPMAANQMQRALVDNRRAKIVDYFNDKVVAEAFNAFISNPESTVSEDKVAETVKDYSTALLNGMQKMATKEMKEMERQGDASDKTLDTIISGINKVLDERTQHSKKLVDFDNFIRKTKKVNATAVSVDENGAVTQTTSEQELSANDKKLLEYAIDYAAEKGIELDDLGNAVATDDFMNYVKERNHAYQMGLNPLTGAVEEVNVATVENRANMLPASEVSKLVNNTIDAYKNQASKAQEAVAEKPTTAPASVATAPVQATQKPAVEGEEGRPDDVPASDDPLGIHAGKNNAAPEAATNEGEKSRNQQIIENAETYNKHLIGDLTLLLGELDKMTMDDRTKKALLDIIDGLVSNKTFNTIKALQNNILAEALLVNEADAPRIRQMATALAGLEIKKPVGNSDGSANNATGQADNSTTDPLNVETPLPMTLSTMDLDFFLNNPNFKPQADYIKNHGIVGFLHRLAGAFKESFKNGYKQNNPNAVHKSQVVFVYDHALAVQVAENMQKAGLEYHAELDSPIVMALEITDKNRHLVEDESQLITIVDVPQGMSKVYMPLGFMPANTNTSDKATSTRMGAIRDAVNFNKTDKPQLVRYPSTDGRNKGVIKTSLASIESHTEEENIPHGTEDTPINSVQQLLEDNMQADSESLVKATDEEKEAYQQTKRTGNKTLLRNNPLYKKLRKAFIDRLFREKNEEKVYNFLKFKLIKGSRGTYPKNVLIKKISETQSKNSDQLIVDLLREYDGSIERAGEVVASNSRFTRLYNQLKKLSLKDSLKGIVDNGTVINQSAFARKMAEVTNTIKSIIDNNLNINDLDVDVALSEDGKIMNVTVYSGSKSEENVLGVLTTAIDNTLSKAEYASFLKDLILDNEGNVRLNEEGFERVKWQVTYKDADDANTTSTVEADKNQALAARHNLEELFDDGIFDMQVTKLAYPARSVTVNISPKMKADLYTIEKPALIQEQPAGTHESKDGQIDGDTGAIITQTREGILSAIPANLMAAINKIIADSHNRKLSEDGNHYSILGQLWARVTSIKYALPGLHGRFNKENGWGLPSTSIGNSLDDFGRDVFNHIFDSKSEAERSSLFESYDNSTPQNYADVYFKFKAFETQLLNKGQIIISTLNPETGEAGQITTKGYLSVTVPGADGKPQTQKVRVAGTLDVLAIDRDGNLHVYDFKTTHSSLDETSAVGKGYDRQLSMYAKFLEDELSQFGVKVKSINIIPVVASYPTPSGVDNQGNPISGAQKTYKASREGSNQLLVKDFGAEDAAYEEFHGANFQVQPSFPLRRLTDAELTASFAKMTEEEKLALVEAAREQNEEDGGKPAGQPAGTGAENTGTGAMAEENNGSTGANNGEAGATVTEVGEATGAADTSDPFADFLSGDSQFGALDAFLSGEEVSGAADIDGSLEGALHSVDNSNGILADMEALAKNCGINMK